MSSSCFSFRHAIHGKIVDVSTAAAVRDAMTEGRVAELINCNLRQLVADFPEKIRAQQYNKLVGYARKFFTEKAHPNKNNGNSKTTPAVAHKYSKRKSSLNLKEIPAYDTRLDELRNACYDRAALVLAGGPSLKTKTATVGLAAVAEARSERSEEAPVVIGVNRARALFSDCDYLAVMDSRLYLENNPIHSGWRECLSDFEDRTFVNCSSGWPMDKPFIRVIPIPKHIGFSLDLREGFYRNFTTTLFAAQAAVWLGCKRIYFGGVDLKHGRQGDTHFFGRVDWNAKKDGDVRGKGLFSVMNSAFERAAEIIKHEDVEIYNLNRSSAVRCFKFASWKDLLP